MDLKDKFDMKDLRQAMRIHGIGITRVKEKGLLWLSQYRYV